MQNKMVTTGKLLSEKGELNRKGYATSMLLEYDRRAIKASPWRIKEWDYYLVTNEKYGIALTLADNGYMGLVSISVLDFKKAEYKTESRMIPFTFGKIGLPSTSQKGDVHYENKGIKLAYLNDGKMRRLQCKISNFNEKYPFECDLILKEEPRDSMVIATPFKEDPKAFYYNQKIVGMKVHGYAKHKDRIYTFKTGDARGILDWGRGVWTYKNTWYWGAATGNLDGKEVGWNIGYGFGDTSKASENMLFYEGKAHKIEAVTFHISKRSNGEYDYMKPWKFTSSDGKFEMDFKPIMDRKDYSSIGIVTSDQHQVFGKYSGIMILEDGQTIQVQDLLGFAERVQNKW